MGFCCIYGALHCAMRLHLIVPASSSSSDINCVLVTPRPSCSFLRASNKWPFVHKYCECAITLFVLSIASTILCVSRPDLMPRLRAQDHGKRKDNNRLVISRYEPWQKFTRRMYMECNWIIEFTAVALRHSLNVQPIISSRINYLFLRMSILDAVNLDFFYEP